MTSNLTRSREARQRAEKVFMKSKPAATDVLSQRRKATEAIAEKTARLRALRLAKEAADEETAGDKKPTKSN